MKIERSKSSKSREIKRTTVYKNNIKLFLERLLRTNFPIQDHCKYLTST